MVETVVIPGGVGRTVRRVLLYTRGARRPQRSASWVRMLQALRQRAATSVRCCSQPDRTVACARQSTRTFHQSALDALSQAGDSGPVVVVDLVKLKDKERRRMQIGEYSIWAAYSEARSLTGGRRLVSLTPHPDGILLGHTPEHKYDLIELTEYPSASVAYDSLTNSKCVSRREQASCSETSVVVWAHRSAAFANMPTFAQTGGEAKAPTDHSEPVADPAVSCPFASEDSSTGTAWTSLETEPTRHMYAFNMLRIPDMAAYKAYSAHFVSLPDKYGMKFVDVLSCNPEAKCSVRTTT